MPAHIPADNILLSPRWEEVTGDVDEIHIRIMSLSLSLQLGHRQGSSTEKRQVKSDGDFKDVHQGQRGASERHGLT